MHAVPNAPRNSCARHRFCFLRSCHFRVYPVHRHRSSSSLRFNIGRYLHARSTDKSAAASNSKTAYHAKAGHLLAQHTPLTVKVFPALHHLSELYLFLIHILHQDFVDGSFGDSFFSKQNVSSENEAKKMRTDVQALACNACVLTACIIVPSC